MDTTGRMISTKSAGEAWLKCLATVLYHGMYEVDGEVYLREICNLYVRICQFSSPDQIFKKYADNDRIEIMKLKYRSCEVVANYKMSYGKLLFDNCGVNQIAWVIDRLRTKPETKSATVGLHHPGESELSCLSLLDFKLRTGHLHMSAVYRSQNVFGSQPGNVVALREIQEQIAEALGVPPGELNMILLSAHIYEHDFDMVGNIIKLTSEVAPSSHVLTFSNIS